MGTATCIGWNVKFKSKIMCFNTTVYRTCYEFYIIGLKMTIFGGNMLPEYSTLYTGCIKIIGAVLKLIIFTSMVNRNINTSRNERVTQQIYDTYLQMFDACSIHHTAHIEAIIQFLPYSAQQVRCDGLHSRGNSVLQIRYAHGLWWHKHFVLHVTPKEVFTRG